MRVVKNTYITQDAVKAINSLALKRSNDEVKEESEKLYRKLKNDLNEVLNNNQDIILTRVVDRKVGKTYTLMRMANEFNIPLIVKGELKQIYKREAFKMFGKDININIIDIKDITKVKQQCNVALKDEGISTQEVIDCFKPKKIKIIGLISIYED